MFFPIAGSNSTANLFLPIAGTNPAEEIDPPYGRYNFLSSLFPEQIPLRKLFLPIACTNPAAEIDPAVGRSESCTCYREEQFPQRDLYHRNKFCCGICFAEEIVPSYNRYNFRSTLKQEPILLRKLFL